MHLEMTKKSGAEATALQTLRAGQVILRPAERLECGGFTIAFGQLSYLARDKTPRFFRENMPFQCTSY
jgi:hypothetical protein